MTSHRSMTWLRRGIVAAFASSGLLLSWAAERSSVERANRLHRDGALSAAATIYQEHVFAEATEPALRYNLGTSLLGLGSFSAQFELQAGRESPLADVRARAFYNVGLWGLRRALEASERDSTRVYAAAAVDANRSALRVRPNHSGSRWNLAMAQRLLDSIDAAERTGGREMADGAVEADAVVRSENMTNVEEQAELPDEAPTEGEDETLAEMNEEAPLSAAEAEEILGRSHLDATLIVQKLLALESRWWWGRRLRRSGPRR